LEREAENPHPTLSLTHETVDKRQLRARLRTGPRLDPLPFFLWERVGERVQAGLPKSPRIQILLLRQCVRVSGSGAKALTLTLSLVRERASKRSSLGNFTRQASCCNQFFRQAPYKGRGNKSAAKCFDPLSLYSKGVWHGPAAHSAGMKIRSLFAKRCLRTEGWGESFLLQAQEFILA
jgi:hypothetical protein